MYVAKMTKSSKHLFLLVSKDELISLETVKNSRLKCLSVHILKSPKKGLYF